LAGNERDQLQQVFDTETGASRGPRHKRIRRRDVRPGRRQTSEFAGIIMEVDPVFTPCITTVEQGELKSAKGMKRVGDPKELPRLYQIRCS
jgi:hypothetical protein